MTDYGLDGRGAIPSRDKNISLSHHAQTTLRPTHPPIQWVSVALSPVLKRPELEPDHSPPSSA